MHRRPLPLFRVAALAAALAAPGLAFSGADVTSMKLGSTFTITGQTGSMHGKHVRALGKVIVSGRWGTDRWHVLVVVKTDRAGNYQLSIRPQHRGNLTLRITPPDHHPQRYLLHVY